LNVLLRDVLVMVPGWLSCVRYCATRICSQCLDGAHAVMSQNVQPPGGPAVDGSAASADSMTAAVITGTSSTPLSSPLTGAQPDSQSRTAAVRCCVEMCWLNRSHNLTGLAGILAFGSGAFAVLPLFMSGFPDDHSLLLATGIADAALLFWVGWYNLVHRRFWQHPCVYVLSLVPLSTAVAYIVRMGGYVHPSSLIPILTVAVILVVLVFVAGCAWYWSGLSDSERQTRLREFHSGQPEEVHNDPSIRSAIDYFHLGDIQSGWCSCSNCC
jgi:hypothetical protein